MIESLPDHHNGLGKKAVHRPHALVSVLPPPVGQLSDQEIIQQKMPLLLGLIASSYFNRKDVHGDSPAIRCGVVSQRTDRWETVFWTGEEYSSAHSLASETLQRGEVAVEGEFSAMEVKSLDGFESGVDAQVSSIGHGNRSCSHPQSHSVNAERSIHDGQVEQQSRLTDSAGMGLPGASNAAVLLSIDGHRPPSALLRTLAVTLSGFLSLHRNRRSNTRRLWQTTTMLQGAAQWQQLDDDQALLEAVARCACEVLGCDRATIFLWDKPRRRLIGRPAIGIAGGVLQVEDDVGIVGEVLQSGNPRWWSAGGIDGARVNRRVDQTQNYETQSLAAVPMVNSRGQIVGVFEAINARVDDHRGGAFEEVDIRTLSELAMHATVAIDAQRARANLTRTRDRLVSQAAASNPLIGEHESVVELRKKAARVAPTDLSVLVLGHNGTGKEVLAQHIHYHSERRNGPFLAVNCAALVDSLLESELFGHEKGAFTGATDSRPGKFELADGGTLFLDEVGDMSPAGQAKLLRVLEEHVLVRVGGSQPIGVDTRLIAATNQPLEDMIATGKFREDLFFRLNVVSLTLPPLAEREGDVMLLAEHFLAHFCHKIGRSLPLLDDSARTALLTHQWPGNVRELRNTMERVCYLTRSERVSEADLMLSTTGADERSRCGGVPPNPDASLNDATRDFQVAHIEATIAACGANMTEAASKLGLHRSNLYRKMRQLGMPTSDSTS